MGPSCHLTKGQGPQFSAYVYCGHTVAHLIYCWALMSSLYHETMSCSYSWQLAKRGCQLPVSFIDFLQLLTYYLLTVYWSATQCLWIAVLPSSCWVGPILCRSLWPHLVWIGRYTQRHCQSLRGKTIRSVLCNIVCNNCAQCDAHTYEHTDSSPDWVLSHWDHFTVLKFILYCVLLCVVCVHRWTWWDWSLSLGTLLPSVLWHCWLGHLTRKNRPRNDL